MLVAGHFSRIFHQPGNTKFVPLPSKLLPTNSTVLKMTNRCLFGNFFKARLFGIKSKSVLLNMTNVANVEIVK